MANERYDVLQARKYQDRDGNEKTAWTNVGVAFANKDGKGFSLSLHCIPVPEKNDRSGQMEYRLSMRLPMPKDEQTRSNGGGRAPKSSGGFDSYGGGASDDDGIPFSPVGDVG